MNYKFTEVEDQFPLFLAAKQIWAKETKGQVPHQKDYPLKITLDNPASEATPTNGKAAAAKQGEK